MNAIVSDVGTIPFFLESRFRCEGSYITVRKKFPTQWCLQVGCTVIRVALVCLHVVIPTPLNHPANLVVEISTQVDLDIHGEWSDSAPIDYPALQSIHSNTDSFGMTQPR